MLKLLKSLFGNNTEAVKQALIDGAVIVDVRTPGEFRTGAVAGSKNIPLNEIASKVNMIKGWKKPVITVCRSGNRSLMAQQTLSAAGIKTINGGAWTTVDKLKQ